MKYILAVVIFGVIILIHELGHFTAAKLCGIRVNKFALGMGPCLLKKQWGETEYSLRLLPIGGFCQMEGEDAESDSSCAFGNKPVWQRMIVVLAGAFMNIVLGFVVSTVIICMSDKIPTTVIDSFHKASETSTGYAAQSFDSGMREGDKIISVDGMRIFTVTDLQYALLMSEDSSYDVVVKRNGERINLDGVEFRDKTTGNMIDFYLVWHKKNPLNVLAYSAKDTVSAAKLVWVSLKDLIIGKYGLKDLSGPVGLVDAIGDAADSGTNWKESLMTVLDLSKLITVNLGIFNILPIPGLDGARFLFLLIEAIRRKPVKPEHEGAVHLIGMALLMALIVVVTLGDIQKLIG